MSDEEIMQQAVADFEFYGAIDDLPAKVIASQWHGGQSSALYSFASTGAITDALKDEIVWEIDDNPDARELRALRSYVGFHNHRGPVEYWNDLHW